jgi:hypothetical protein
MISAKKLTGDCEGKRLKALAVLQRWQYVRGTVFLATQTNRPISSPEPDCDVVMAEVMMEDHQLGISPFLHTDYQMRPTRFRNFGWQSLSFPQCHHHPHFLSKSHRLQPLQTPFQPLGQRGTKHPPLLPSSNKQIWAIYPVLMS